MKLDYSILSTRRVLMKTKKTLHVAVIGCGGSGSWTIPHLVRMARLAQDAAENPRTVRLDLWDPDTIEEKNIYRQNFCGAELGMNKAQALALRYGPAWGVDMRAFPVPFEGSGTYDIVVGCVDNPEARRTIHKMYQGDLPSGFWVDCGNAVDSGQVLIGNTLHRPELAFPVGNVCVALPLPTVQHPELLEPAEMAGFETALLAPRGRKRSEPFGSNTAQFAFSNAPNERSELRANPFLNALFFQTMSCAEQALYGNQGLTVNAKIAAEAADFFYRLVIKGNLRKYATYFDLVSGSTRSKYITPDLSW